MYVLLDSTEWKHLPEQGGLIEQDDLIMEEIALIAQKASFVRAQLEVNESEGLNGPHS
jgi:hypothetical protein